MFHIIIRYDCFVGNIFLISSVAGVCVRYLFYVRGPTVGSTLSVYILVVIQVASGLFSSLVQCIIS